MTSKRPSSVDKHISRRILERRKNLRLTQPDLAEKAGVSFQQFQKYENGEDRVPAGRLYEIARALKANVAYFYPGGEGAGVTAGRGVAEEAAEFEGPPDDETAELVRILKSMDTAKRKSILTMVKKEAAVAAPKKKRKRG